jgi:hypothetical protein
LVKLRGGVSWRLLLGLLACLLVAAGCGTSVPDVSVPGATTPVPRTAPDGRGAIRPAPAPAGCTKTAVDPQGMQQALDSAVPGDHICLSGDMGDARLVLNNSGTARAPITVSGDGHTSVHGISVEASYVTVENIDAVRPDAPGISLFGDHITLRNCTSISPRGDDGDGLRFWGSNISIVHNTIRDTRPINRAHADCMQTFATDPDHPASQHILIDSNRCEKISNTCLIMEGPNSLAGDGSGEGVTEDVTYTNNYCQNKASEALQIDDVQNMRVIGNEIASRIDHAFAFQNHATGVVVRNNKLNPGIHYEVGMDDSSRPGYQGTDIGGDP